MYNIINVDIPKNPYKYRQFCTSFDNALIIHRDNTVGPSSNISVYHDNKQVLAGLDWGVQSPGNKNPYGTSEQNIIWENDYTISGDTFLMHDDAGANYMHFFFNFLSRLVYFEELRKTNSHLKLGIIEDFYTNTSKWSYIKEWLDLFYEDKNIKIVIFKKDKKYTIENLIISNCFYGFPEIHGFNPMIDLIKKVTDKISPVFAAKKGCYISRQDTIKLGWYHKRELENELELIEKIKFELDYDIIELINYSMKEKIQLSKSYKNIIQQSSASNINILFSKPGINHIILTNPKMGPWLNEKCTSFSNASGANLLILDEIGELITGTDKDPESNPDNYPWMITDIDGVINILKQIDNGEI
jgi:hypothetical protein